MDAVSATLKQLIKVLATSMPDRLVTDVFVDSSQRVNADLMRGVVTVVIADIEQPDDWSAKLHLKIVGQVMVASRDTTGADVQAAETKLWQQLSSNLRNLGAALPKCSPPKTTFSRQIEHPYGWIAMDVTLSEFDLATGDDAIDYPPPSQPVGDFASMQMDFDIDNRAGTQTHQAWAKEQTTTIQPNPTSTLELQQ